MVKKPKDEPPAESEIDAVVAAKHKAAVEGDMMGLTGEHLNVHVFLAMLDAALAVIKKR